LYVSVMNLTPVLIGAVVAGACGVYAARRRNALGWLLLATAIGVAAARMVLWWVIAAPQPDPAFMALVRGANVMSLIVWAAFSLALVMVLLRESGPSA